MKKIYYIVETHYYFDDNGKKCNEYEDVAIIDGYRRGFETEVEAKTMLQHIKNQVLFESKDRINPLNLTFDGEIIIEMENEYVGRTYRLEILCV